MLATGDIPLGRLWSHLVLGLLAARRDAPVANPHLDELWRLAVKLDLPGVLAPATAALAEQVWITRRADPRLHERLSTPLVELPGPSGDHLRRWLRRLGGTGMDLHRSVSPPGPVPAIEEQPYEQALARWDDGTSDALLAALPLLDELDARAVAARVRGRLRELGVTGLPRGRSTC